MWLVLCIHRAINELALDAYPVPFVRYNGQIMTRCKQFVLKTIRISISQQTLTLLDASNQPLQQYAISSAQKGISCLKNSGGTPIGKHIVRAKIGAGLVENSVLVGRRPTGEIYSSQLAMAFPNRDWILTRILWLSGLQKGVNRLGEVDTMQRYIYIHGTPDAEPMGVANSHGCIRMRNADIMALFDQIEVNTPVEILP